MLRTSAARHHLLHAVRLEEHVVVRLNGVLKRFVGHNLRLALHERLKAIRYRVEVLFSDFLLPFCHVVRLFAIERIRHTPRDKHVQLNAPFALFFLDFVSLGELGRILGLLAGE